MAMMPAIVLLLLVSPVGMFVGHVVAYRALGAAGRRPTAHTSAFAGIAICFVAVVGIAGIVTWTSAGGSLLTVALVAVYVAATYGALSILYLDIVNIAE